MTIVRALLGIAWLVVAWATWRAISAMGVGAAGDVFMADIAHPWRGQFNLDFLSHLLLVGLWLGLTARSKLTAPLVAVAAVLGGGLFSFAYLIVRSLGGDGSLAHLLLGRHHRDGAAR